MESTFRLPWWRVWIEGDTVRVARDGVHGPEHLELVGDRLEWRPHTPAGMIPWIELADLLAYLDQGGR